MVTSSRRAPSRRTTALVTPNQARALATPARPQTPIAAATGRRPITAATTDSVAKSASSQAIARGGGRVRHQDPRMPPWLSGSEMSSMTGTVARKGQENGRMATPSAIAATGESSRQDTAVSPVADRNMSPRPGTGTFRGQASRARAVFRADRIPRTAASRSAKPAQDRSYPYIQRRSWNRASGATAVTCPASERAGGASQQSSAASVIAAPADSAIRPRWARNSLAGHDPAFRFMELVRPPCCGSGWLDLVRGQHRGTTVISILRRSSDNRLTGGPGCDSRAARS